jgi:hypothetical protein
LSGVSSTISTFGGVLAVSAALAGLAPGAGRLLVDGMAS